MHGTSPSSDAPRALSQGRKRMIFLAALVALGGCSPDGPVSLGVALLLGIIEGITEYLPVSSTGHLAVASLLLIPDADEATRAALDSYVIVIQGGAIVAVLLVYFGRVRQALAGAVGRDPEGRKLFVALIVAFLPAVAAGLLLGELVKDRLFGLAPIAWAWIVGGVVILVTERLLPDRDGLDISAVGPRRALIIGCAQVLAMWPGTSRSLATILGGRVVGLSTVSAVEFSFLLGVVTLGAAASYEALGGAGAVITELGLTPAVVGFVAATVSAIIAVRWLIAYLSKHSLAIFGWYRIVIGMIVLIALI